MGYYSTIDIGVELKNQKGFWEAVEQKKKSEPNSELVMFFLKNLIRNDYGQIYFKEYTSKFYGEQFIKFIKPFVTSGEVKFTGEDGMQWGYYFDGEGRVFNLVFITKQGEELFED